MWKSIRIKENNPIASYNKYFKIFSCKFNLGFGNPRSDFCSFCELSKAQIKKEIDAAKKVELRLSLGYINYV